jgi:hypothetical protein
MRGCRQVDRGNPRCVLGMQLAFITYIKFSACFHDEQQAESGRPEKYP